MSGGGGFYRFRCRNYYTHNCQEWVYINNTACNACLAAGREGEDTPSSWSAWRLSKEILVPQVNDGSLHYVLMEVVAASQPGNYWALREKVAQPPVASIKTTSDTARAVVPTTGAPGHVAF